MLAVDQQGDATAVWGDYRATGVHPEFSIVTATRRAGSGSWSAPAVVSGVSQGPDEPVLALAGSGAGVIAWTELVPTVRRHVYATVLEATTRPSASAPWTAPAAVSSLRGTAASPQVAIDATGEATAVWNVGFAENAPIESASVRTSTGAWSKPQKLSVSGQGGLRPQLAINARGDGLVAWPRPIGRTNHRNYQPTIHYAEMASYRPAGRAWQAPLRIGRLSELLPSPGTDVWGPATPSLVLDARGAATVTWQSMHGTGQILYVAHRPVSAKRWQSVTALTTNPIAPVIATDAEGGLTVAWTDQPGRILFTSSQNGTRWSRSVPIPDTTGAFLTWLSVGPKKKAILTWRGPHAQVLVSTRRTRRAAWTHPRAVGRGGFPQAALDAQGTATIIWPKLLPRPQFGATIQATTYPPG